MTRRRVHKPAQSSEHIRPERSFGHFLMPELLGRRESLGCLQYRDLALIRAGNLSETIAVEIGDNRPTEWHWRRPTDFTGSRGAGTDTPMTDEKLTLAVTVHVGGDHRTRGGRRQLHCPFGRP